MKGSWGWRVALLIYAGLIFALSCLPFSGGRPILPIPYGDKVIHFGEFFLFALLAAKSSLGKRPLVAAVLLAGFYGGTDEFHQIFVPARDASIVDWGADLAGALCAAGFVLLGVRVPLPGMKHLLILNRRDLDKEG